MVRITPTALSGTALLCVAVGCANFVETQAISHFTAALEKGDLDKLKDSTSDPFQQKALRSKEAPDALKILNLRPNEKQTIVKVKDVKDTDKKIIQKKVEVTTVKTHRMMQYNLIRDAKTGKWVVDDIIIKQKGKDVTAVKSVTEQMDLLLVVQDFLIAWHHGKRDEVQGVTTPSFGKLLGSLPPAHLQRLTRKVAGERLRADEFRPEATIDENDAIVKLQRPQGILILTMKQTKKGWRVANVAMESRKDKDYLASARQTATVIRTVVDFLKAYKSDDKQALQPVAARRFYDECLKVADLKVIPLPGPDALGDKDIVKTHAKGGEYVVQADAKTVKLSLSCLSPEADDATYVVDDVTIFDAKEEKRISALFTAQAKMQLFVNAIMKGNLTLIKANSTADLRSKVWNKLGSLSVADLLPAEIELEPPVIERSDFHGSMIRIHVRQGSRELTYVMRDWSGEVTVDDVLMPVLDRPKSMKETMQALLPVRLLATALREASVATDAQERPLQILKSVTSNDFNRVVWTQFSHVPEPAYSVLVHLNAPLTSISDTQTGQVVVLGDDRFGARIELNREREFLVIDRIWMLTGSQADPPELKFLLKSQLSKNGPRGIAVDPMSAEPIATEPPRTAEVDSDQPRGAADSAVAAVPAKVGTDSASPKTLLRPSVRQ